MQGGSSKSEGRRRITKFAQTNYWTRGKLRVTKGLEAIPQGVRHFLPFSAGYRLLDAGPNFEAPVAIADLLGRPQYALIFGGYALISLTIGTFLLYRRDSN